MYTLQPRPCGGQVFDCGATQEEVYQYAAKPIVDSVLEGFNGTIMCYGQTGTGKTYTFGGGECLKSALSAQDSDRPEFQQQQQQGSNRKAGSKKGGGNSSGNSKAVHGVVGRALQQVMEWANARQMKVCISYVQVYMELLQDLLRPESNVSLREHPDLGVYLDGACWKPVPTAEAACAQVAEADARRTTAFTRLNADSSRSHAVLLVSIRNPADADAPPPITTRGGNPLSADAEWASSLGRLFLVDLAGSERVYKTGVNGQILREAK